MKRYDNAYRFASTVLKNLGWKSEEVEATLTDDLVRAIAAADENRKTAIFRELEDLRQRALEEDDDADTQLRSVDFRCTNPDCLHEMRDQLVDVPMGYNLTRLTSDCSKCGSGALYFIPHGTRLAMKGEENVPRERLDAARRGLVRNPPPGFEPYKGDGSRSSLEAWEARHNISPMAADEGKRGNATVNTKAKHTQTVAFEQELAGTVKRAWEIAEAGGDRLAEEKAKIEQPNQYDADKFKQQVSTNVVDGDVPLAESAMPVSAVAEEITATP
jgi:hypothetical protein